MPPKGRSPKGKKRSPPGRGRGGGQQSPGGKQTSIPSQNVVAATPHDTTAGSPVSMSQSSRQNAGHNASQQQVPRPLSPAQTALLAALGFGPPGLSQFEVQLQQWLNMDFGMPGPPRKLRRLVGAARHLFTNGKPAGGLPADVAQGQIGLLGPKVGHVMAMRRLLETVAPADLGLALETIEANYQACAKIAEQRNVKNIACCWDILQTPLVSLVLFMIPAGAVLEMHGHPGMVVLTKVIAGELDYQTACPLPVDLSLDETHNDSKQQIPKLVPDSMAGTLQGRKHPLTSLTMLPVNEPLIDYGAVPTAPGSSDVEKLLTPNEANAAHVPLTLSTYWRRQLLRGSRMVDIQRPVKVVDLDKGYSSAADDPNCLYEMTVAPEEASPSKSWGSPEKVIDLMDKTGFITDPVTGHDWVELGPSKPHWPTTLVTVPTGGTMHRFAARGNYVCLLDILSPNYDTPAARSCYYLSRGETDTNASKLLAPYSVYNAKWVPEREAGPDVFVTFDASLKLDALRAGASLQSCDCHHK